MPGETAPAIAASCSPVSATSSSCAAGCALLPIALAWLLPATCLYRGPALGLLKTPNICSPSESLTKRSCLASGAPACDCVSTSSVSSSSAALSTVLESSSRSAMQMSHSTSAIANVKLENTREASHLSIYGASNAAAVQVPATPVAGLEPRNRPSRARWWQ